MVLFSVFLLLTKFTISYSVYIMDHQRCGAAHVTINSRDGESVELNWVTNCKRNEKMADKIVLAYEGKKRIEIKAKSYPEGYYLTGVKTKLSRFPHEWNQNKNSKRVAEPYICFDYYIYSYNGKKELSMNCLSIFPKWMEYYKKKMGSVAINKLFIPGTHNSGAYGSFYFYVDNYVLNQDRTVYEQLVYGIRYFDLRVGYYPKTGFSINHDTYKLNDLVPILSQIKKFLQRAKYEVVILDFHRFPYPKEFTKTIHRKLVSCIKQYLGSLIVSDRLEYRGVTLNTIWDSKKQVIVSYGNAAIAKEAKFWSPLKQFWGDKRENDDLKAFLRSSIYRDHSTQNPLWALMAECTVNAYDVIFGIFGSYNNRKYADYSNREITKWFKKSWANDTNVVASDFFLGNNLIQIAIETNYYH